MTSATAGRQHCHQFHPSLLREYDLRGRIGERLFAEDAYFLGRAVATEARSEGHTRLATGLDGRLSSPELEQALVEGLCHGGIAVTRLGRGPTPLLYFGIQREDLGGGVMVTVVLACETLPSASRALT